MALPEAKLTEAFWHVQQTEKTCFPGPGHVGKASPTPSMSPHPESPGSRPAPHLPALRPWPGHRSFLVFISEWFLQGLFPRGSA